MKFSIIETMREEKLSCRETARRFGVVRSRIAAWERICLEEGAEGFAIERRGRGSKVSFGSDVLFSEPEIGSAAAAHGGAHDASPLCGAGYALILQVINIKLA